MTVNIWPILVATIVSFGIGSLWYSPILFGTDWMNLVKSFNKSWNNSNVSGVWKHYLAQLIATIVSLCVLAFFISTVSAATAGDGAFLGFLVWLGFTVTESVGYFLWEQKPLRLILINSIGTLLNLIVSGAILGAWK